MISSAILKSCFLLPSLTGFPVFLKSVTAKRALKRHATKRALNDLVHAESFRKYFFLLVPPPLMVRGSRVGGPPEVTISGSTLSDLGRILSDPCAC